MKHQSGEDGHRESQPRQANRRRSSATRTWQVALVILAGTVVGVVSIACLYWAQAVCMPVALALFLAFLLAPLASALERRGLGRAPSVALVVLAALFVFGGLVWVVGAQARSLASEMPKYTENIEDKIKSLRKMAEGWETNRLRKVIAKFSGGDTQSTPPSEDGRSGVANKPTEVVVHPDNQAWLLSGVLALLGKLAEALGGLLITLVLLIFMLLKREDLRNRLIRLVGDGRLTATTKALDDASQRVSRYLLMQLIVNSTFGLTLALGLLAIGVPYALLWGFLGFVLRYLPYIGPWIAASGPILLSLAVFPGWVQPLLVVGLVSVVELLTSNVIEPRLYGRSIGVSETALLVAAAFCAFLWGPVGLVLSSPLTVCLVVLGKYVPHLKFLDVLLGDEPALPPDVAFYQRLLARDKEEATELVLARVNESAPESVYDELFVPSLNYLRRDRHRGDLRKSDEEFVLQAMQEILGDLAGKSGASDTADNDEAPSAEGEAKVRILMCPARDNADRGALTMLRQLLKPARWEIEIAAVTMLASDILTQVAERAPRLVCIGALPPGGLAHARYLCKRLRKRFPAIKIIVGRWGLRTNHEGNMHRLQEAGADLMASTLLETRRQLRSLFPILIRREALPSRQH